MNARLLFVATTFSAAAVLGSMAGCTINANDNGTADAAPIPNSSSSSSSSGSSGGGDAGAEASTGDGGQCLGTKERGPLCHADGTPEPAAKCGDECDVASTAFTSDIALAISTCIDEAVNVVGDSTPTPQDCEAVAAPCVAKATAQACTNDVTEFCKGVTTTCPDKGTANVISAADCEQYFRGATTQGKQLLLDCLETEKADPMVCKICLDALKTVHKGD